MLDVCIPVETTAGHSERKVTERLLTWIPIGIALLYPWALRLFHDAMIAKPQSIVPAIWLIVAFALPLSCLLFAWLGAANVADVVQEVGADYRIPAALNHLANR